MSLTIPINCETLTVVNMFKTPEEKFILIQNPATTELILNIKKDIKNEVIGVYLIICT